MTDEIIKSIYLYKPPETEKWLNTWVYYYVASVHGPDEPDGTLGAPIQVCKVKWPTFEDIPPMTDTPGVTGYASAHDHLCRLLKTLWGVEHENSIEIGWLK